ncbi:alpha/beta hydrolase [Lewinella sp. IMCC34183]|uniref:alpha/beta hydrolase n=1 Tax=Lewinella sp. IMCC34183 TaxID=2248762 RepID=UPI000E224A01|nr:alpha/beta hydrolase [Lewinella sp. IMCC34183]
MLDHICRMLSDGRGLPSYWRHSAARRQAMNCVLTRHAYGPHRRQYLLLLEPPGTQPGEALPWAFYFHGGGWAFGTPEAFSVAGRPWLAAGFRVVLPSFRRPPVYGLPDIVHDCRNALAATARLARATGRPLSRPHIGGISSGGHLAALLALHPDWWAQAGWPGPPDHALLCAAPSDLRLLSPSWLFGRYAAQCPARCFDVADHCRWLLLHGTRDGLVDYAHAEQFLQRLRDSGADARLLTIPGGGHLDAGRWTYNDADPYAKAIADFVRSAGPGLPAAG